MITHRDNTPFAFVIFGFDLKQIITCEGYFFNPFFVNKTSHFRDIFLFTANCFYIIKTIKEKTPANHRQRRHNRQKRAERRGARAAPPLVYSCAATRARIIWRGGRRTARIGRASGSAAAERSEGEKTSRKHTHSTQARGQGREKFSRPTRSRASESERATRATRPTGPTRPPAVKKNRPARRRSEATSRRGEKGARGERGAGKGTGGRERAVL